MMMLLKYYDRANVFPYIEYSRKSILQPISERLVYCIKYLGSSADLFFQSTTDCTLNSGKLLITFVYKNTYVTEQWY